MTAGIEPAIGVSNHVLGCRRKLHSVMNRVLLATGDVCECLMDATFSLFALTMFFFLFHRPPV